MSDEAVHKNILSIKAHAERSREIVRELQFELKNQENKNKEMEVKLNLLQAQIQSLQVKMFSGGATSVY